MSDGIKGAVSEAMEMVNESVVEPVKDEVGQLVEAGVQSITGSAADPQKQMKKQQEDQRKMAEAKYKIDWWKQVAAQQAAAKQQQLQQKSEVKQEEQQEKQVKQYEVVQKKQDRAQEEAAARSRAESKAGKGVGG